MQRQPSNRRFILGMLSGVALAAGAALMLGMNNQPQQNAPEFEYYVTQGDQAGTTARLWRRNVERENLEFVGMFQATQRGR